MTPDPEGRPAFSFHCRLATHPRAARLAVILLILGPAGPGCEETAQLVRSGGDGAVGHLPGNDAGNAAAEGSDAQSGEPRDAQGGKPRDTQAGEAHDAPGHTSGDSAPDTATGTPTNYTFFYDHEDLSPGTLLSQEQIQRKYAPSDFVVNNADPGLTIVADPVGSGRGNVLQVFFPVSEYGNSASGCSISTVLPAADEYYFAFDLLVLAGFDWPLGCKLPGLWGGDDLGKASGGTVPDGESAFAVRQGWYSERHTGETAGYQNIGDGALSATTYLYDQATRTRVYSPSLTSAGTNFTDPSRLTPGTWATIEQRVKLNTATGNPGEQSADGVYEAWVDGVLVYSRHDFTYRTVDTLRIDHFNLIMYYGGGSAQWAAREGQFQYLDNVTVSTSPITHAP